MSVARAAEVLAHHTLNPPELPTCRCGWDGDEIHHADHVAAELDIADLLVDVEQTGQLHGRLAAAEVELDVLRPGVRALLAKAGEADAMAQAGGAARGVLTTTAVRAVLAGAVLGG